MASLFSTLATTAGAWARSNPDHGTITAAVGHGAGANRAAAIQAVTASTLHSPIVVAFQISTDPHLIYLGYHPQLFVSDIHNVTPYDNNVMVMVGDNLDTSMGLVLPADTFARTNMFGFRNQAYITGAAGYATAGGAVRDHERQAGGAGVAVT